MSDPPSDAPVVGFTHLHVHSQFTLLGATPSVARLVARAADDGFSHLALTDTNALYGAVAFDKACRQAGIRPILGMAVTVAPLAGSLVPSGQRTGLLVLLATGQAGYRSLCHLSTAVQGHRDRLERAAQGLDWESLKQHREGLICITGGRQGWIERSLRAGNVSAASRYAGRLAGIYGENACLALELHQPGDMSLAREVAALGQRLGLPAVAVRPVYCLNRQEQPRLRLLAAIDHNCLLQEVPDEALPAGGEPGLGLHWLSPMEMQERYAEFPAALDAVAGIAARCDTALPDGRPIWPALKLPEGETPDSALASLADQGLAERYPDRVTPEIRRRLQRELDAIAHHGYSPLFLLVADIVRFARRHDVPVSTRGSVANSLVAYCTGITTVDPIRHDLLFERFLSPARLDPPDIDLDFCSRRRDRVLHYVRHTYGADRVALVATVSTMRLKSAVRETGKAYGLDDATIAALVKKLPSRWHPDPRRRTKTTLDEVLATLEDRLQREVVEQAGLLEGQPHHLSVHPGGLVVAPGPLIDVVPVQWTAKGFVITQFDHQDVEAIGLPKVDLLGIRALTVLADAAGLVRRDRDPDFRLDRIPLDDPHTGELLARGDTVAVFQCESDGARRTLRQLNAHSVRDLAVANAFFKPGPATGGMARTFVRRYRGEAPVAYLHPSLEPILGTTKGVLIFQEQILRVATEIAGLSWEQADHLRRGMSKFQAAEMERMRVAFIAGCRETRHRDGAGDRGLSLQQAETLWEQVLAFAGYGFNQGHATAYADISYRSAYLKSHWPAAFLCARLADWGGFHHPAVYMAEAIRLGIAVRPPHVNQSGRKFTLTRKVSSGEWTVNSRQWAVNSDQEAVNGRGTLWMGLGQVRDLRRASVRAVVAQRQIGPFAGVRDLLGRVPLQAKEATHLIQCGALDGLGSSRAALLAEFAEVRRAGSVQQLAFDLGTVRVEPESPAQRLAWERHILGQPVSVHPLALVQDRLPALPALGELGATAGRPVQVAGARLPGWTGSQGFYLSDGTTYVTAKTDRQMANPHAWEPILVRGRWRQDEWGSAWLQVESWSVIE